jgi:hypothetical protein
LLRKNIKLMIHRAAADADLSGPGGFFHRIKRTAFRAMIPFVSDISAARATFGSRMVTRIKWLPTMLGVSFFSALFTDATVPGVLLIPLLAALGADAAVPSMLFIPLLAAFGADASVPRVLFIPLFTASFANAAIPGVLK